MKYLLLIGVFVGFLPNASYAFDAKDEIRIEPCMVAAGKMESCVELEIEQCVGVARAQGEPAVSYRHCAHVAFEQVDEFLNEVYRQSIAHISTNYPDATANTEAEALVRESQRAWVEMRVTSCRLFSTLARVTGGDIEAACAAKLTLNRIRFLQDEVLSVPSFSE